MLSSNLVSSFSSNSSSNSAIVLLYDVPFHFIGGVSKRIRLNIGSLEATCAQCRYTSLCHMNKIIGGNLRTLKVHFFVPYQIVGDASEGG